MLNNHISIITDAYLKTVQPIQTKLQHSESNKLPPTKDKWILYAESH